jgi:hypothetical protein
MNLDPSILYFTDLSRRPPTSQWTAVALSIEAFKRKKSKKKMTQLVVA